MELLKEIVVKLLENNSEIDFKLIEMKSYQALKRIKAIVQDDSLSDEECFLKIEEIVNVLEELGSNGGNRHDFG